VATVIERNIEKLLGWFDVVTDSTASRDPAPNYTLKLSRPGFGPGLKPLVQRYLVGVTPLAVRHSVLRTSLTASSVPLGLRHAGPGRAA
jgi:hypothetical protein